MKKNSESQEWLSDFSEFLGTEETPPPSSVSERILDFVHRDLNPNLWIVLSKLSVLHLLVGGASLFMCSQFGLGRTTELTHSFMKFGETACMVFCGALFLGLTVLIADFLLNPAELRRIRQTAYSPLLALGLISLLVFLFFGAEIVTGLAIAWLAGALLSGVLIMETGLSLRKAMGLRCFSPL